MREAILALLLSFHPFSQEPEPESEAAREARLSVSAEAIDLALPLRPKGVSEALWAGALVALGRAESRWAAYVWHDRCETGPYKCDDGRAKGPFQAHRSVCPLLWELPGGSVEWHQYAAKCASGRLTGAWLRCRARAVSPLSGAFSGYAGASCTDRRAPRRAADALRFATVLGG